MANTYSQCYLHLVFAVQNRDLLIRKSWKESLEKYITGIIQGEGHKLLAIGTMPDHIHIFIGYNMNQLIPELVEKIKTSSNKWIKENKVTSFNFSWQKGYGCFSNSQSQIDSVVRYVLNQEEHHKCKSFKDEYLDILKRNNVDFDVNYLFDFLDVELN